jgi:hypothetical protein
MRNILIIAILVLVSCEDSLVLQPKMYISADEAFSSAENVAAAVTGCYDALQLQHYYGRNLVIAGDLASDNGRATGTKVEYYSMDDNTLLSDNILVEGIWREIYTAINRVNYVLYKLDGLDFLDDETRNDYEGQMKFLRALHYFNLVRLYGKVPLTLDPTLNAEEGNYLARTDETMIYVRIVEDLDDAIGRITNTSPERATREGALALLALVDLTIGDYLGAKELAGELYDEIGYLEEDVSELFNVGSEPSREILFYVSFNPNDKNRMAEYHMPNQLAGRYEHSPTEKLVDMIEAGDSRRELIAAEYEGKSFTTKYSDLNTGSDPVIVLRTADLLFIEAEAMYFIDSSLYRNEIIENVNTIRERAGLDPHLSVSPGMLWEALDRERQIEFAFEGKRWFDLIRTGRAISEVETVVNPGQTLFPIPLSEILANPYISMDDQNPGY